MEFPNIRSVCQVRNEPGSPMKKRPTSRLKSRSSEVTKSSLKPKMGG